MSDRMSVNRDQLYHTLCIVPKATKNPDGSKKWRLIQSLINVSENSLNLNFKLETPRELIEKIPPGSTTFSFFDARSSFDSLMLKKSEQCFTGCARLKNKGPIGLHSQNEKGPSFLTSLFLAPDPDNPKTVTTFGQTRFPQGHCNGTGNLVLTYNDIFRLPIANHGLAIYCDDYLLGHKTIWGMLKALEDTLAAAKRSRVRFSADKSYFAVSCGVFSGHEVSANGISVPRKYCERVKDIPTPSTTRELQRFLGLVCYVKSFIQDYSKHVALLTPLINQEKKTGHTKLVIPPEGHEAIKMLKKNLLDPLSLHSVDYTVKDSELHVFCDASDRSYGCVLFQKMPSSTDKPDYRLIDYYRV